MVTLDTQRGGEREVDVVDYGEPDEIAQDPEVWPVADARRVGEPKRSTAPRLRLAIRWTKEGPLALSADLVERNALQGPHRARVVHGGSRSFSW